MSSSWLCWHIWVGVLSSMSSVLQLNTHKASGSILFFSYCSERQMQHMQRSANQHSGTFQLLLGLKRGESTWGLCCYLGRHPLLCLRVVAKCSCSACKHCRISGRLKPPTSHLHALLWHWSPHVCPACPPWLGPCRTAEPSAWLRAGRLTLQKQTVSSRAL